MWTTWAHVSDWAVCLARTDPDVPKRKGITYFLVDLHEPGVEVRPLRHITGEVDFNEVFLDERPRARLPAGRRRWATAGRSPTPRCRASARWCRAPAPAASTASAARAPTRCSAARDRAIRSLRQRVVALWAEEQIRAGPTSGCRLRRRRSTSIGKVHQGELNQRIQLLAVDLLGARRDGVGPRSTTEPRPYEVKGMLRSRANTIEGGTTEVNKNIIGERVLGLPREPDPYDGVAVEGRAAIVSATQTLDVERDGPRRLADLRPARPRQRDGRHDARRARAGLAASSTPTPTCG